MVEHFADSVLTGRPLRLPPEDAVANLRVIEALRRSLHSGRVEAVGGSSEAAARGREEP
jgi:predicted dehydrogenase